MKLPLAPASAASLGAGVTSGSHCSSEEPGVAGVCGVGSTASGAPLAASGAPAPSLLGAAGAGTLCSTAGGVMSGSGFERKRL